MAKSDCEDEPHMAQSSPTKHTLTKNQHNTDISNDTRNVSFKNAFGVWPPQKLAFFVTDTDENTSQHTNTHDSHLLTSNMRTTSSEEEWKMENNAAGSACSSLSNKMELDCLSDDTSISYSSSDVPIKMDPSEVKHCTSDNTSHVYPVSKVTKLPEEHCVQVDKSRSRSSSELDIKMEPSEDAVDHCVSDNSSQLYPFSNDALRTEPPEEPCVSGNKLHFGSSSETDIKMEPSEEPVDISMLDNSSSSGFSTSVTFRRTESLGDQTAVDISNSSRVQSKSLEDDDYVPDDSLCYELENDDKQTLYECDTCDKIFNSESDFARHLITHTEELPFDCEKSDSVIEYQVDAGMKQFPVEKTSLNENHIIQPERECDKSEETPKTVSYKCDLCSLPFYSESAFAKHLIKHCEDTMDDKPEVIPQQKSHTKIEKLFQFESIENENIDNDEPIVLKKIGDDIIQFEVHKTQDGERLYEIKETTKGKKHVLCDQAILIEYKEMFFEIVRTEGERRFLCKICDRSYTQKSSLNQHLRSHTGVKPYKCRTCEKTFARHSHLFQHERTHTGEKPFKCEICNATFTQKANVLHHQRVHTGEKPHKCHLCDKAFSQKSNLHYHIKIHSGEKPFRCEICNKTFNRKSNLTVHIKAHLRDKHVSPYML